MMCRFFHSGCFVWTGQFVFFFNSCSQEIWLRVVTLIIDVPRSRRCPHCTRSYSSPTPKHLRSLLQPTYSRGDPLKGCPLIGWKQLYKTPQRGRSYVLQYRRCRQRSFELTCLLCCLFFFFAMRHFFMMLTLPMQPFGLLYRQLVENENVHVMVERCMVRDRLLGL